MIVQPSPSTVGVSGSVEIQNDSGNAVPVLLKSVQQNLGYYNSSALYPSAFLIIPPIDVTSFTSVTFSIASISSSVNLLIQTSSDNGLTWTNAYTVIVPNTYTITVSSGYNLWRVMASGNATAGTTSVTVTGTSTLLVESHDNPTASVSPYSTSTLWSAGTVLTGPYLVSGYRSGVIHVTSWATGTTLQIQFSNDNSNWFAGIVVLIGGTPTIASSITSTGAYAFNTAGVIYARIVTTTQITAGTLSYAFSLTKSAITLPAAGVARITNTSAEGVTNLRHYITAATTNLTSVKTSGGMLNSLWAYTGTGKTNFVKLYNKASAPVIGTDTPDLTIGVANGQAISFNCGTSGIRFTSGIAMAITAGMADNDATATAAGDTVVSLTYA